MGAVSAPALVIPASLSDFPDSGDLTKFGPRAWNEPRLFEGGDDGEILTRDASSPTGASWAADVTVTKADVGLGSVENTALSTWAGSTALTVLGGSPAVDGVANHYRVSLAGLILDVNTDPLNANFSFNELVGLYTPTLGLGGVGHDNFFLGLHTGTHCTSGCGNLAIGHSALASIVDGIRNVSIGWDTHLHQVSGSWNVTIGVDAMRAGLGSNNVAIGDQAGLENSGSDNVIIGKAALDAIAASQYNVAVGEFALTSATSNRNTGIGYSTLSSAVAGADNTALGFQAGRLALGSGNVFLGFNAGNRETGGNKLYIDNNGGNSEANGRVQALIYGVFDVSVANQSVTINGALTVTGPTLSALNIIAAGAMVNRTKAGTPVDGDVTGAADGMVVVDTTASKIWVRIGGTWKGVAVA